MKSSPPFPTLSWLLKILLFAGIYFVAARLSLLLAFENTNASPVWPPSGIAFGTLLFFGYRYWPGITIGAFLANMIVFALNQVAPSPWPILAISLIIAIGNTLEALAGVFLVRYILGHKDPLENPMTIFRYLVIVISACLVSSVIGSLSLCLFKFTSWNTYLLVWFTWWLGDAAGILVLSTLFLPFYKRYSLHLNFWPVIEGALFLFFIFCLNLAVFGGYTEASLRHDPLSFLFIPAIVWAIFRLGEHGLGATVLMIVTTAIWGTIHGYGPFAKPVLNDSLLILEGFVGVVTMTGLILMATLRENKQAQRIIEEKEKWFRSLVENSYDIITLLDEHGRITYSSPATTTVLGYALKDYVGKNIFSFIHPDDLETIKRRFKEVLGKAGNSVSDECRFRHSNGSWKWLEGTGVNLIKDESVRAIVINCRDITTRRQAQEAQARLAAIVNNSSDAIIGKTMEGIITSWNRGAQEIYGYRPDDVLGRSMMILIPPARQQEFAGIMQRLKRGEEIQHFESVRQRKDGKLIDVSLTISLVRNSKGDVIGASTIARDITERKRAQERLKHYAQELKESNEDLENFAFVASHDLQEPLRIVASYIQMFAKRYKESTDANVNKYITYIVDNVARMQEMINGLLEYSRIGKKSQTYHHMEASRVCDRAISNLDLAINKKQASVTRDELPVVWGNETEWTQLFQNLIGNAIKYCDKQPLIHVGVKDDSEYWTFFIKDNGIGIEKQYCEQIFDVFKRLHTKAEYPGTGIGLSICKKIVEKNGGQVWVESTLGEGSTFFFTMSKSEKNERSLR